MAVLTQVDVLWLLDCLFQKDGLTIVKHLCWTVEVQVGETTWSPCTLHSIAKGSDAKDGWDWNIQLSKIRWSTACKTIMNKILNSMHIQCPLMLCIYPRLGLSPITHVCLLSKLLSFNQISVFIAKSCCCCITACSNIPVFWVYSRAKTGMFNLSFS